MHVLLVGFSFKTSPLDAREATYFPPEKEGEVSQHLDGACTGLVVISTCHRTEVYLECDDLEYSLRRCWGLLAQRGYLNEKEVQNFTYSATDLQAARHLLRVASGLDSMVIGERQILGQVRRAYERALRRGEIGPVLSFLFPLALATGKMVHTHTGLGKRPASLGTAALALAKEAIGPLDRATALIIGGGEMGAKVGKELAGGKIGRLLLLSKTYYRAQQLAAELGGIPVSYERMEELLVECELVVSASGAPHPVVSKEAVRIAASRRTKPLLFIDLGVPRNIPPEVARIPGVVLHNIDDLQQVVTGDLLAQREDTERAEAIVEDGMRRFKGWLELRPVDDTIGALGRELEDIRQRELARALPKLSHLSPKEVVVLNSMTKAIVKKFLFGPATVLREKVPLDKAQWYRKAIEELFLQEGSHRANGLYPHGLEGREGAINEFAGASGRPGWERDRRPTWSALEDTRST